MHTICSSSRLLCRGCLSGGVSAPGACDACENITLRAFTLQTVIKLFEIQIISSIGRTNVEERGWCNWDGSQLVQFYHFREFFMKKSAKIMSSY